MKSMLEINVDNRERIYQALKEEFIGPYVPQRSVSLDTKSDIVFDSVDMAYRVYKDLHTGEEILQHLPTRRYGVAVLYPINARLNENSVIEDNKATQTSEFETNSLISENAKNDLRSIDERKDEADDYEFDIVSANTYQQSSMAISFKADFSSESELLIHVSGGRYQPLNIKIKDGDKVESKLWWLRLPVSFIVKVDAKKLIAKKEVLEHGVIIESKNMEGLDVRTDILSRPIKEKERLITVSLVNKTEISIGKELDSLCLFQSYFKVEVINKDRSPAILPYPEIEDFEMLDDEELSLAMLYRKTKTYSVGHGCAANWGEVINDKVRYVESSFLPYYEMRSMTPDIKTEDGTSITVSMKDLAGLNPLNNGMDQLREIVRLYEQWILDRWNDSKDIDPMLSRAAKFNLKECEKCLERMKQGLEYLQDPLVYKAFQLANEAMLLQQIIGGNIREAEIVDETIQFSAPFTMPDIKSVPDNRGNWRAFQIAFILMTMKSTTDSESPDRETVDLLFFPTGGGKTEAYLGLSAFAMFLRRLKNQEDIGTHILMRYTLRLLTADQFQRASRLLCAMEFIRKREEEYLGSGEFSIGIWLGGDTTPNTHANAINQLKEFRKGKSKVNPFLITSCPFCGAKIGKINKKGVSISPKRRGRNRLSLNFDIHGYKVADGKVSIHCTDTNCNFYDKLPIYVVDEDIYEERPTLIIGTVDKFVQLAWNSRARSIFGIGTDGERFCSPPDLILQDELHLISGPLGSMSGLFEVLIEELCTDYRNRTGLGIKPKIVCSTATIRRYKQQIRDLYARNEVALFPAPGLDEEDSFFATSARDEHGQLMPGRKYVGINAPSLGSMQTLQVRALTTLLQAPMELDEADRDPWWTLLIFFNSLRELGTTVTLLQSDVPNHLRVIKNRADLKFNELRRLNKIKELTSRLSSDEIASAILELKTKIGEGNVTDICLASNIIEVGVDIDRLSLMSVIGQPKTTAQYIQVTGRVGRRWYERPGLVVTLYNASKPRDRSHFEKFRSYHEKLYAQVEPTSVTPYSPAVIDRMLHAVMVGYVRQFGPMDEISSPTPLPENLLSQLKEIICERVKIVDIEELENVKKIFDRRIEEWRNRRPSEWSKKSSLHGYPLLYQAGTYVDPTTEKLSWATPNSMRNVDAQCLGEISVLYLLEKLEGLEE